MDHVRGCHIQTKQQETDFCGWFWSKGAFAEVFLIAKTSKKPVETHEQPILKAARNSRFSMSTESSRFLPAFLWQTPIFHICFIYSSGIFFHPEFMLVNFSVSWNPFLLEKNAVVESSDDFQAERVMKLVDSNGDVTGGFTTGSTVVMSWGQPGRSSYNP